MSGKWLRWLLLTVCIVSLINAVIETGIRMTVERGTHEYVMITLDLHGSLLCFVSLALVFTTRTH